MAEKRVVASLDVGRPKVLSEKLTICFKFHNFASLKQKRGERVACSPLPCHGYRWTLMMYPSGSNKSAEEDTYLSIYLCGVGFTSEVDAKFSLQVGPTQRGGKNIKTFSSPFCNGGWHNFARRADVLDPENNYLVDGTLTVEATIQAFLDKPETWSPPPTFFHSDIGRLYESKKSSDVTFVVGGTQFQAHRLILESRAPNLAELAENISKGVEIEISNVEPAIFDSFLHFVYKGVLPKDCNVAENAVALLEVADKYGCTSLKLIAEAELAASHVSVANASDMLLLADSKNCALLKETVLSFFVANRDAVMKTEGYSQVKESPKILNELMNVFLHPNEIPKDVGTLRRKLFEAGLDVDGTREMLVKRLRESTE